MSSAFKCVSVPISVPVSRNKRFSLNLNQYRNAHHQVLSKAKNNFQEIVAPVVRGLPQYDTVTFVYTLFTSSEQLVDTGNVCSIVDKFFSDVMVNCGRIKDDNRKIVLGSIYLYGEVDRVNPRCEVTIIPGAISFGPEKEEEPMQIRIIQHEIEEAIRDYVLKKLTINEGQRINIELMATRGEEGYTAVIDVVNDTGSDGNAAVTSSAKDEVPPPPASKSSRPKSVTKETTGSAAASASAAPETPVEPEPETKTETQVSKKAALFDMVEEASRTPAEPASEAPSEEEETPAPARPSLFGNLSAPDNH